MLTQHSPRVPRRPALPHGVGSFLLLAALAIVTAIGIFLAIQPRPGVTSEPAQPAVARNIAPGIAPPADMGLAGMPRGYTDYLIDRSALAPLSIKVVPFTPGIAPPADMGLAGMPRGYTDYLIAPLSQPARSSVPGIALPRDISAVSVASMPRGYTDYLLNPPELPTMRSSVPGIALPAGMRVANMPRGYTDYLLSRPAPPAPLSYVPGLRMAAGMQIVGAPRGYSDYVIIDETLAR